MTARAATSAATAHLPTLRRVYSLFGRHPNPPLQTTNRFYNPDRAEPFVKYFKVFKDFDHEVSTKKMEELSTNEDKPIVLARRRRRTTSGGARYTVLSVEDDGKLSTKYDIYPPFPPSSRFGLGSSCNGLVCLNDLQSNIFLWNPKTNESKILPLSSFFAKASPSSINTFFCSSGIWFDHESQDHKVMRFISYSLGDESGYPLDTQGNAIELYSLRNDSWKKISCPEFHLCSSPGVCINGVHYMRGRRRRGSAEVIVSFDISTETISSIPKPIVRSKASYRILDYNGLLSLLLSSNAEHQHWIMRNGSWLLNAVFFIYRANRPISFSRNGELLFIESESGELFVFDSATGKLKRLHGYASAYELHLIPFSESSVKLSRQDQINLEEKEKEEEEGLMVDAEEGPLMA